MSDFERVAADAAAKAAADAGRGAAKRAAERVLGPEGEGGAKTRRWKLLAVVVLGLCVVVGLIGLILNYWFWFLVAGALGLAGLFGYWRLRARLAARGAGTVAEGKAERAEKPEAPKVRVAEKGASAAPEIAGPTEAERRAEAEARQRALEEARVVREQEVEDELAAMKKRLQK